MGVVLLEILMFSFSVKRVNLHCEIDPVRHELLSNDITRIQNLFKVDNNGQNAPILVHIHALIAGTLARDPIERFSAKRAWEIPTLLTKTAGYEAHCDHDTYRLTQSSTRSSNHAEDDQEDDQDILIERQSLIV